MKLQKVSRLIMQYAVWGLTIYQLFGTPSRTPINLKPSFNKNEKSRTSFKRLCKEGLRLNPVDLTLTSNTNVLIMKVGFLIMKISFSQNNLNRIQKFPLSIHVR